MRRRRKHKRFQRRRGDVAGALVPLNLEDDPLPPLKRAHAGAFDGGHVNKDIWAAVVGMNESMPLLRVEPPHGSDVHDLSLGQDGCANIPRTRKTA